MQKMIRDSTPITRKSTARLISTSTKPNGESNLPTNNQNIIDMKILRDNAYNRRPIKNMTASRLRNRANKEYVLHFRCKELGTSYTIGINADLLVWAYQYRNGVLIRSFKEENIQTFEEAYKFFVNSCNHCLLEQRLVEMAKTF
nr:MAG TPA: hypothetical protein [Caudoviricetes sp.]